MHGHRSLVISRRREHLRRFGRNGGVLIDDRGHHATHGFDTQGQRGDVEQQHISHVTRHDCTLQCSADGHGLIGIDVTTRLFAKKLRHFFQHQRHTGLTANQNHIGDVRGFNARIS